MAEPYTIQRGDTLSDIARRNGISMSQLREWNPVFWDNPKYQNGNMIFSGGKVWLGPGRPGSGTTAPWQPAPETPVVVRPPVPEPAPRQPSGGNGVFNPPGEPQHPASPEDLLKGEQRDAYLALKSLFGSYGLGSLAPKILEYVQEGYGADTIGILLQRTDEYKQRFAGNEARRAAGLQVLSPAEYLATEQAYRQLMRNAGLPEGFYDQPEDFTQFISKDVSPTELKQRVDIASLATTHADPATKQALQQMGISGSDVTAYFLDPTRATTLIQKQMGTAQIGAAALRNNLEFNQGRAADWYLQGVTSEQAAQGYGAIAGYLGDVSKLGQIYGEDYNQATAEAEVFGNSGAAQQKRRGLASQERASFGGATGGARGGLTAVRQQS